MRWAERIVCTLVSSLFLLRLHFLLLVPEDLTVSNRALVQLAVPLDDDFPLSRFDGNHPLVIGTADHLCLWHASSLWSDLRILQLLADQRVWRSYSSLLGIATVLAHQITPVK